MPVAQVYRQTEIMKEHKKKNGRNKERMREEKRQGRKKEK